MVQKGGMAPVAASAATATTMADSVLLSINSINMNPYVLGLAYITAEFGRTFHGTVGNTGTGSLLTEYRVSPTITVCHYVHRNAQLGCRLLVNISGVGDLTLSTE